VSVVAPGTRWYNAVWRWHFYAGLFCIPFVVWLALTGTIYLWRPQVEALLDRPYDRLPVAAAGRVTTAAEQVAAAVRAVPGSTLHHYVLPDAPGQAVRVLVATAAGDRRVYVDPQSLAILHIATEDRRPFNVLMRLHGELLAGTIGSYLVEIAACWAIVMLLTGLYLWWPRGRSGLAGLVYPRLRGGRRVFWRDIHAVAGLWVSVCALGLIVTGLPWAAAWGRYLGEVRAVTGTDQGPVDWTIGGKPPAPTRDPLPGAHDGQITPPAPGPHDGHLAMPAASASTAPGDLARVVATVRPLRLAPPVLIAPPTRPGAPWAATSDTADRPRRATVQVDGATGRLLGRLDFADRHWIDRTIGYGIAAHEGALFGLANQLLGTLTALLLIVLAVSGAIMWWRRRPHARLGAPPALSHPRFGAGLGAAIVLLGLAMPLFGATLIAVLILERTTRHASTVRRWLGLRAVA